MAKKHGAKQQKRLAKQKAKRQAKRSVLARRSSNNPTLRLQHAEKWPIVRTLVSAAIWDEGIGYCLIARQEPGGSVVFASFLVDVYCLGVKDAFWDTGSMEDFREIASKMEEMQHLKPISPACFAKVVRGAVAFALSFGFPPHPDYRNVSLLLEGIDPGACTEDFAFGKDGKPFYFQGPNETVDQAKAIAARVVEAGGDYVAVVPGGGEDLAVLEEELDDDEDDEPGGPLWRWPGPRGGR